MFCHNCGAEAPDDAFACDECGAALIRPSSSWADIAQDEAAGTGAGPGAGPGSGAPRDGFAEEPRPMVTPLTRPVTRSAVPTGTNRRPVPAAPTTGRNSMYRPQTQLSGPAARNLPGDKNKVVAGVLAIMLGSIGAHKFYLGRTGAGMVMLLVTLFSVGLGAPAMGAIGLIEGVLYLTKNDDDFRRAYVEEEKAWF